MRVEGRGLPAKLPEQLIKRIEAAYLASESETYDSVAKRFRVSVASVERLGKEREWSKRRGEKKITNAQRLSSQLSQKADEAIENCDVSDIPDFDKARLLRIVRKGLLAFELAFDQNSDSPNPKVLSPLASGVEKLIQLHLKLDPPSIADLVEELILAGVGPDEFLAELREAKKAMEGKLLK